MTLESKQGIALRALETWVSKEDFLLNVREMIFMVEYLNIRFVS